MGNTVVVRMAETGCKRGGGSGDVYRRLNLSHAIDLHYHSASRHGVTIEAVYLMPRSKRVIIKAHFVWDDGRGNQEGVRYHEASPDEVAHMVEDGLDMRAAEAVVPELVDT